VPELLLQAHPAVVTRQPAGLQPLHEVLASIPMKRAARTAIGRLQSSKKKTTQGRARLHIKAHKPKPMQPNNSRALARTLWLEILLDQLRPLRPPANAAMVCWIPACASRTRSIPAPPPGAGELLGCCRCPRHLLGVLGRSSRGLAPLSAECSEAGEHAFIHR